MLQHPFLFVIIDLQNPLIQDKYSSMVSTSLLPIILLQGCRDVHRIYLASEVLICPIYYTMANNYLISKLTGGYTFRYWNLISFIDPVSNST